VELRTVRQLAGRHLAVVALLAQLRWRAQVPEVSKWTELLAYPRGVGVRAQAVQQRQACPPQAPAGAWLAPGQARTQLVRRPFRNAHRQEQFGARNPGMERASSVSAAGGL
jgi:hypothetical protein